MIGISGSLIWSKTLLELIFNPCGEFREVRRAQLAKPTHLTNTLVPLGSLRSFKVCSDAKERVGRGKQRKATVPIQSLVKLQQWFLSVRKICLRQNCTNGSCVCVCGRPAFGRTAGVD